jgi:Protein of unknown function (DUF4231)
MVFGAAVAVLAAADAPSAVTAALAACVVVLEGVQQVFQFHPNWIIHRTTAETLRQNAFAYLARVGAYASAESRRDRLAQFMRDVTTNENASWTSTMRQGTMRQATQPPSVPS